MPTEGVEPGKCILSKTRLPARLGSFFLQLLRLLRLFPLLPSLLPLPLCFLG